MSIESIVLSKLTFPSCRRIRLYYYYCYLPSLSLSSFLNSLHPEAALTLYELI